jgi:phenylacetate-CoA ligase
VVQNAYGYGLFTGGLGFHQGATVMGCTVVPTSSGLTERQITLLKDFEVHVLCCTPSYALTIAERAEELKVDLKKLPLSIGIFGAEPWTAGMREEIEARMGIKAMEAYGLTELGGPGVGFDCEAQSGIHINEDHYLAEVVDPITLEPVPLGEKGELIFTSLQRRAMPMIRYRTKDITRLYREKCVCGRTFIKMDKIFGRTDDMLIISGVNVFPSQIESLLLDIEEVEPQYRMIVRKKGYLDQLVVQVEAKKEVYAAGDRKKFEVEAKIMAHIAATWGSAWKSTSWNPSSSPEAKARPFAWLTNVPSSSVNRKRIGRHIHQNNGRCRHDRQPNLCPQNLCRYRCGPRGLHRVCIFGQRGPSSDLV